MTSPSRFGSITRALRHRNYRLFFVGQGLSLVGNWITIVATGWLVYRLTGSAALLGMVGFAGQIPVFLLSAVAGTWVDRLDRYRVMVAMQVLAMLQSFALAALTLTGAIQVWHVLALQVVQGVINAFDAPARQASVADMVDDRADLPNAIALNSIMFNGARLIGPSVAGVLIAAVGEGWCFFVDGVSYGAVLLTLLAMRLPKRVPSGPRAGLREDLREGLTYAFGTPSVRAALLLLAAMSLFGVPYHVLMPVVADRVLHGGPRTLGLLMGAVGIGALVGAVYMASRRSVVGLERVLPVAAVLFGLGLVGFSWSTSLWLSLALLVLVGLGFLLHLASTNTILQTAAAEHMRGRVMSLYVMAFIGMAPFGSLWSGAVAERIGAPATIRIGGVLVLLSAAVFARRLAKLRERAGPADEADGVVPAIAQGLGGATAVQEEVEG